MRTGLGYLNCRTVVGLGFVSVLLVCCQLAPASGSGAEGPACPVATGAWQTFSYQGNSPQYVRAPAGVSSVSVQVRGGFGGHGSSTGRGGRPGLVEGRFGFTGRPCFEIYVADWGGGTGWGFGSGGGRGVQVGAGHDGAGGGGASALVGGGSALFIAGGGGGGGGDGSGESLLGGDGGDGAGGEGPGTPNGGKGDNGMSVPDLDLGGLGGIESGRGGGKGVPGTIDLFAGAGGGGGGGANGGGGGGAWMGTSIHNIELPYGGGGGGGGSSFALTSIVTDVQYLVSNGSCGNDGANCRGSVSIQWDEHAARISAYAGGGQSRPITSGFDSRLEARVTAASGDPVPGTEVTFELPADGPSATFASPSEPLTASATTNGNGIAVSPPFQANGNAGQWTATASAGSLKPAATFALTNRPAGTAIALYSSPEPSNPAEPVELTAVVGASPSSADPPSGKVVFRVDDDLVGGPVPVGPGGVALSAPVDLPVGKHSLNAEFAGSPDYLPSSRSGTHEVRPGQAVVKLGSSQNPSPAGAGVSFEAKVEPAAGTGTPTGSVQFSVDGEDSGPPVELVAGQATTSAGFDTTGPHQVRARYSGDENFGSATGSLVQSVGDEATATTVSSSDLASSFGGPLTLTATVSGALPPSGTVSFAASAREASEFQLCPEVTLTAGRAECVVNPPLPAGSYEILAGFEPDQVGVEGSEGRATQLVLPAPSRTSVRAQPDPLVYGQGFQGLAEVTSSSPGPFGPSGWARFSVDGAPLGNPVALNAGVATLPAGATPTLGGGAHTVAAGYGGSPDFRPGAGASVLTVDRADTVTTISSDADPSPSDETVNLEAEVKRADGNDTPVDGKVQFWADGRNEGEPVPVRGGSATYPIEGLGPGEHDLRAYFTSPENYQPSEAKLRQVVDSPPQTPEGAIPCGPRRVSLTSVYRKGSTLRFEGAGRRSTRGMRVRIVFRGRSIARTTVRSDGTFWARAKLPPVRRAAATRFVAVVNGRRSRSRRLGRPLVITGRSPHGTGRSGRAIVTFRLRKPGRRSFDLVRQRSCRLPGAEPVRRVSTNRRGKVRVNLPRPAAKGPFAVYRLVTPGGRPSSTPILVRAPR